MPWWAICRSICRPSDSKTSVFPQVGHHAEKEDHQCREDASGTDHGQDVLDGFVRGMHARRMCYQTSHILLNDFVSNTQLEDHFANLSGTLLHHAGLMTIPGKEDCKEPGR